MSDPTAGRPLPRLWTPVYPDTVKRLRNGDREWVLWLPNGHRARVTVDDSGSVFQRDRGDGLDACVRPKTHRTVIVARGRQ